MKKSFLALASALLLTGIYSFAPATKSVADTTLTVATDKSRVEWSGSVKDHSHPGIVPIKSGTVTVDGGKLTGGKFVLDVAGVKSTDGAGEKLDGHLKSADFLDAAKYPEAVLEIKSVTYSSAVQAEIAGVLSFKGVDAPIKFPAYIRSINEKGLFAEAFFAVNKKLIGLNSPMVSDDVQFSVHISAK